MNLFGEQLGAGCSPGAIAPGLRELLGDERSPKDPIILSGNWTMRGFSTVPLLSSHFLGRRRHFGAISAVVVPFFGTTTTLSADFRCRRPSFWDDSDTFGRFPLSSSHFLGRRRHFQPISVALVPLFGTTATVSDGCRSPRPIFWDDDDTCEPQNPTSDSPVIAAGCGMPSRVSIVGAMSQRRPSRTVRTSSSTTMNCTLFSEWAVLGVPSSLTA